MKKKSFLSACPLSASGEGWRRLRRRGEENWMKYLTLLSLSKGRGTVLQCEAELPVLPHQQKFFAEIFFLSPNPSPLAERGDIALRSRGEGSRSAKPTFRFFQINKSSLLKYFFLSPSPLRQRRGVMIPTCRENRGEEKRIIEILTLASAVLMMRFL